MFDKEYSFRGSHAEKVKRLTSEFDGAKNKLFQRNLDVYLMAPIVGFLYGAKADLDATGDSTKIFPDQLIKSTHDLLFNYRLIMLLDKQYCPDFNVRVDKAFRLYGKDEAKADLELYEAYVRGGVDKIYEKLMEGASNAEEYLKNLYEFMEDIEERYSQSISTDSIIDLCSLARS